MGLIPIRAPVLEIVGTPLRLPSPGQVGAILVTSGNALAALSPGYHEISMFAVGDATAERARTAGFRRVASAAGDAEALAKLIAQSRPPSAGSLLLATGRGQGKLLAGALRQAGFAVVRRVVYAAEPVRRLPDTVTAALRAGDIDAAMFFSPETASHFVRLLRRADLARAVSGSEAVAISRRSGMALEALPWRRIRIAAKPNQDEMLALLR
jgi:uroporphyrinogen-III synthase